jgi:ATP-binding cassette subfamily C (CFTR/MRP) protein 1
MEKNFYARCPPDQRPRHLAHLYENTDVADQDTPDNDKIDVEKGMDQELKLQHTDSDPSATAAPTPTGSHQSSEKSKTKRRKKTNYDQSLFKAILRTFRYRIWLAGILKLLSGEASNTFQ